MQLDDLTRWLVSCRIDALQGYWFQGNTHTKEPNNTNEQGLPTGLLALLLLGALQNYWFQVNIHATGKGIPCRVDALARLLDALQDYWPCSCLLLPMWEVIQLHGL